MCSTDGMTCLHCSYIPVSLNNKELKSFKPKCVISVMPIKPARAFQREGEGARECVRNHVLYSAKNWNLEVCNIPDIVLISVLNHNTV